VNLKERRAWMREGCPVEEATVEVVPEPVEQAVDILERKPEPEPEIPKPCRSFRLGVIPSHGVLIARCDDCGIEMEHGEIILVDTGLEEKVAQGDWDVMLGLCIQMNEHGQGAWGEVGSMLIGKPGPKPWQAIEAWVQELMLYGACTGMPGNFEQSGWRFSFNRSPLRYELVLGPKWPGFLAKL